VGTRVEKKTICPIFPQKKLKMGFSKWKKIMVSVKVLALRSVEMRGKGPIIGVFAGTTRAQRSMGRSTTAVK